MFSRSVGSAVAFGVIAHTMVAGLSHAGVAGSGHFCACVDGFQAADGGF